MIGHYIANFIMLSPKVPAEEILRVDRERGFGEASGRRLLFPLTAMMR